MVGRDQTVMWIDALEESKEHWKDNLRKAQLITAEDLALARRFNNPPRSIQIGSDSCACCKTARRSDCKTPCPLDRDPTHYACHCCEEWFDVHISIYDYDYSKEEIIEAMKKMIKRIDYELRVLRKAKGGNR